MKDGAHWSPERVHNLALLRDVYEELLPPRQRQVMRLKLDEDLSLAEIAEHLGVSRQACEDALKRGERALLMYEEKLGVVKRKGEEEYRIQSVISELNTMNDANWRSVRDRVLKTLNGMIEGGELDGGV